MYLSFIEFLVWGMYCCTHCLLVERPLFTTSFSAALLAGSAHDIICYDVVDSTACATFEFGSDVFSATVHSSYQPIIEGNPAYRVIVFCKHPIFVIMHNPIFIILLRAHCLPIRELQLSQLLFLRQDVRYHQRCELRFLLECRQPLLSPPRESFWKGPLARGLVNTSAIWSWVGTKSTIMVFIWTCSRIKWNPHIIHYLCGISSARLSIPLTITKV